MRPLSGSVTRIEDKPWLAQGEEKRRVVRDMFAAIAPTYDRVNGIVSFRMHHRWRSAAVRAIGLRPGERVLDLCCGTGDFFAPIRRAVGSSGRIVGMDFCLPMLEIAGEKFGDGVELALADATRIPVQDGAFDAVTVGWGLRNVPDLGAALREAARVLRPGGRFVSVDMTQPRTPVIGPVSAWAARTVCGLVGRLFGQGTAYRYLPESAERFASPDELSAEMAKAGFEDVQFRSMFFGNIGLHWGVRR